MKAQYFASFEEGKTYHIYNRTNNKEVLFKTDENRLYFLKQYAKYLEPFVETFCWTLLPNHFHFLVRIKQKDNIKSYLNTISNEDLKPLEKKYLENLISTELLLEFEWKRFFTSYAMAFNKQQKREGNLFNRPFKRVLINNESHFTQTIIYIHANAFKHGVCSNYKEYKWSLRKTILSKNETKLFRQEVLNWFGGAEAFIKAHEDLTAYYYEDLNRIDDD